MSARRGVCRMLTVAKLSKPQIIFRLDAVDTSPDLEGQKCVLKTFEMAILRKRRTTRKELEKVFCRWIYFHLRSQIFFWPS